jgi:tRNA(Arg) A34 adenosine deaminase TadA
LKNTIFYPDWVLEIVSPGVVHKNPEDLMRICIRIALANVKRTEGGPFGAIVATDKGEVVSIGYNQVVPCNDSTNHAEILALRRAERLFGTFCLRSNGLPKLRLFTSCAPCIMCTGAIHWAGVPEVIAGARREDAEDIGFLEGPKDMDVPRFMREREIAYKSDFLRNEVLEVFKQYKGLIYNG